MYDYEIEFLYAFSLNKMKAVILPTSSQEINVKLLHVHLASVIH